MIGQRVAGLMLASVATDNSSVRQLLGHRSMAVVAIDNRLDGQTTDNRARG